MANSLSREAVLWDMPYWLTRWERTPCMRDMLADLSQRGPGMPPVTIYFSFLLSCVHPALPWPRFSKQHLVTLSPHYLIILVTLLPCHPCHPCHLIILVTSSSLSPHHPCHLIILALAPRPRPCLDLALSLSSPHPRLNLVSPSISVYPWAFPFLDTVFVLL